MYITETYFKTPIIPIKFQLTKRNLDSPTDIEIMR